MKTLFSAKTILMIAMTILLSVSAFGQAKNGPKPDNRPVDPSISRMAKVDLPCTVQATQIGNSDNYTVKLVATNTTGAVLAQGKKINFTYGPSMKGSFTIGSSVPSSGKFTMKQFSYTAEPYLPTAVGCTAYFFKILQ